MKNKRHWYDGKFYDIFIAPNQDKLFGVITSVIKDNSSVLDVGCGTGRFTFQISPHAKSVTGIDLSLKNISLAMELLRKGNFNNITFIHTDATDLSNSINSKFDYAVMTYVIHEMPEDQRVKVIKEMKGIADKIIIGDYIVPQPKGFPGKLNSVVEFAAGKDHYRNFKNYVSNGGLIPIFQKAGMNVIREVKNKPLSAHIIVAE